MESRESIESMGVMGNIQVTKSMLIMETLEAMSTMETKEATVWVEHFRYTGDDGGQGSHRGSGGH